MSELSRRAFLMARFRRGASPEPRPRGLVSWLRSDPGASVPATGNGHARILRFECLAGAATGCTVCAERCPVPGALLQSDPRIVPSVDPDRCNGCGACARACPAPGNAVILVPDLSSLLPV
jgi:ferredoxin